jgi:hypothetical protein
MTRSIAAFAAVGAGLLLAAPALAGHGLKLDHAVPFTPGPAPPKTANSGGQGAEWEFLSTFATGNPHTDVDFFTQGNRTYASVGTLAIGPNAGGQTIIQLAEGDEVAPKFVSSHPTASCLSDASAALSLQHDVEATPKGNAILNTDVLAAQRTDTQLLLDATDAEGRCHDQGTLGLAGAPKGGIEIIDVTDPAKPVTIGLTSHIGEAHTVNVDPKRPHIAYAVTSDSVTTNAQGERTDETFDLDGFEVVDLSSCMNFPAGTTVEQKRAACRPQVWRYRYPSTEMSLGHTHAANGVYGCHELEVYPDDRLTCASGAAMILLDMSGAFDDRGTPTNFSDDRPRGTPLPCRVRDSSSAGPFVTGAQVTDCVATEAESDALGVPKWLAAGAPSLEGVEWLGSAFHPGRESTTGGAAPAFDSTEDIDFDHEAELTHSGDFVLATDERGGGVAPPGASCSPGVDNKAGNGGVHAYRVDRLLRRRPSSADDAHTSYARTPEGDKAIFRAPIRTGPQDSLCTAHVFHQIPGQNRIFMGWYSQGTRVIDFTEHADGTISFEEAAWFIPSNADEWVSAVFKVAANRDGTFTYWGTAGDFNFGNAGRNAIDVWRVTLPPPPAPRGRLLPGTGAGFAPPTCVGRRARFRAGRLGRFRVGLSRAAVLRKAGRPVTRRSGRVWRYCVKGEKRARVTLGFDKRGKLRLIGSTAAGHRKGRIAPGGSAAGLATRTRRAGRGLLRSNSSRFIFGVRGGKVRFVATVDRRLARSARKAHAYVRMTRLR